MRRMVRRYEQDLVERKRRPCRVEGIQMAEVDRIECAAEDTHAPHHVSCRRLASVMRSTPVGSGSGGITAAAASAARAPTISAHASSSS